MLGDLEFAFDCVDLRVEVSRLAEAAVRSHAVGRLRLREERRVV